MLKRRRNRNARSDLRGKSRADWLLSSGRVKVTPLTVSQIVQMKQIGRQKDVTLFTFASDSSRPGEGDASGFGRRERKDAKLLHLFARVALTHRQQRQTAATIFQLEPLEQRNAMESESCQSAPATWWAAPVPRRKAPPVDPRCPVGDSIKSHIERKPFPLGRMI